MIDENTLVVADLDKNILVLEKQGPVKLIETAGFNLGDEINILRTGQFAATTGDDIVDGLHCILFGTVGGSLGVIVRI